MSAPSPQQQFGQIDIYLFDQILKGHILPGMRIVDAGCGSGRNLIYFLREGYEVFAADADARAVEGVRAMAQKLAPTLPESNFRVEPVEQMSFDDRWADIAISSAVLHFARDDEHFEAMLRGTWRVLKPGGLLFCRLASTIGMEDEVRRVQGRPPNSSRWAVGAIAIYFRASSVGFCRACFPAYPEPESACGRYYISACELFQTIEGVGVPTDQQQQGSRLRIRLGTALFPFFEGSLVDPQLPCEHSTGAIQPLSGFFDEL